MATKIRKSTDNKKVVRFKRKKRIRSNVVGTAERPRLVIFRSNAGIYAQMIDDTKGTTLVAASTIEKVNGGKLKSNLASAKAVGKQIAEKALAKKIDKAVFDRAGYIYHGKIKALADAAREAGLKF